MSLRLSAHGSEAQAQHGAPEEPHVFDDPAWLEDEEEEPCDSPWRGMWVGVVAAIATFTLVFALPLWLGWYDLGSNALRDASSRSVISSLPETAPAPPSGSIAQEPRPVDAPPITKVAPFEPAQRSFWVQVAAFKDAKQAGRLAARVKRAGYPVDVRRLSSSANPWVVWVGKYPTREQAESVRAALARKGLRGFVL